jgi:hypothetical protein
MVLLYQLIILWLQAAVAAGELMQVAVVVAVIAPEL